MSPHWAYYSFMLVALAAVGIGVAIYGWEEKHGLGGSDPYARYDNEAPGLPDFSIHPLTKTYAAIWFIGLFLVAIFA